MSYTPVFDQTVAASDADLWKASPIFPQPSTHRSFAADRCWPLTDPRYTAKVTGEFPLAQYVADGLGVPLFPTIKSEPTWRTFLRCLFWWLP